tara:strand:+ start:1017 stop:1634 length:618 start_codon:yes stop_codon:yes gene_type:complete
LEEKGLQMNIKDAVKVYDGVIQPNILEGFITYCKNKSFEKAHVVKKLSDEELNKIRNAENFNVYTNTVITNSTINNKIYTDIHWKNILQNIIKLCNQRYIQDLKIKDKSLSTINEVSILKYQPGGHYILHSDYHTKFQREFSFILFVNDDYEGGELHFADPNHKNETIIKPKKNRVVFFPSNFMYPHKVNAIKNGTRYSVVAWLM